ncbi:MAG: hypothetical protein RL712_177 [Bacteroidota bacterium]
MFNKGCKFAPRMNFFSHFLIDHKTASPAYNVALIMPDLLRNFTPKSCKFHFYDKHQALLNQQPEEPKLLDFLEGCIQHIERDKAFHSSAFFSESYQLLRNDWMVICKEYEIPKYWFSLHVLIEIMLDKYYIDNNIEKLTLFYHELKTERDTVVKGLDFLEHPEPATFMERYDRFCEIQYLFHYQNIDRIAYALHRIYQQIGLDIAWYSSHENPLVIAMAKLYDTWKEQLLQLGLHQIQRSNEGK